MKCIRGLVCFLLVHQRLLLWWLPRQVGDEGGDGADVRYDSKHDGENGEPQGLARRCVGPLEIPLSRRLVGLRNGGEIRIRG